MSGWLLEIIQLLFTCFGLLDACQKVILVKMADNFDEKSGIVPCKTPWGQWYQTMDEVVVEINVAEGTMSKEIKVEFKPKHLTCRVKGDEIKGELCERVLTDDCLWSLEDRKKIQIMLVKSRRSADNCWPSLFVDGCKADPLTFDQMEKKMTLERFQKENPGFDFSGADITGGYSGGGPQWKD